MIEYELMKSTMKVSEKSQSRIGPYSEQVKFDDTRSNVKGQSIPDKRYLEADEV